MITSSILDLVKNPTDILVEPKLNNIVVKLPHNIELWLNAKNHEGSFWISVDTIGSTWESGEDDKEQVLYIKWNVLDVDIGSRLGINVEVYFDSDRVCYTINQLEKEMCPDLTLKNILLWTKYSAIIKETCEKRKEIITIMLEYLRCPGNK